MSQIDWLIFFGYLLFTLFLGYSVSRRNRSDSDYFVAGRKLSGMLAGASMAATTFSIDTPLYVAGLVGSRGLAGNWEWWSFGMAHVAMTVIFSSLWRRSGVITDAAFTELRYGGIPAAWLRGVKAFLLSVPINCIGIGYAFLAMRKVAEALEIVNGEVVLFGFTDTTLLLIGVAIFMLIYTVIGGLWAVVLNDFFQLIFALIGAFIVAIAVLNSVGGINNLIISLNDINRPELMSFFPWELNSQGFKWIESAEISFSTFLCFITIQWWSFRRSDGGGEFIQRMLATRDEKQAELSGWVFLIINYLIRSWLWIIVALSALVLLPDQNDWELSYPILAMRYLPPVAIGLVIVSLVAAFMSTVSTSLNWGASYLTHDLYQRFIRPSASQKELLFIAQITSVILLFFGIFMALVSDSIGSVFRLVIAIGTGPGVVLVLRWFWWRINAFAELAAMVAGFLIGFSTSVIPIFQIQDYGLRLLSTTLLSAFVWLTVLFLTPPESRKVLEGFVHKVRPPGPGWRKIRRVLKVEQDESLKDLFFKFLFGVGALYGGLLGTGGLILHQERIAFSGIFLAIFSIIMLGNRKLFAKPINS
mgnify:CR=1 FL=1|tara:strand:- start:1176 stop:2939 length:1764 start_codon:yes stop_codon:yes gene_type:complete